MGINVCGELNQSFSQTEGCVEKSKIRVCQLTDVIFRKTELIGNPWLLYFKNRKSKLLHSKKPPFQQSMKSAATKNRIKKQFLRGAIRVRGNDKTKNGQLKLSVICIYLIRLIY